MFLYSFFKIKIGISLGLQLFGHIQLHASRPSIDVIKVLLKGYFPHITLAWEDLSCEQIYRRNHDRCNIVPAPPASAVCHKSAESVSPSLYTPTPPAQLGSPLKCDPILNNNRPTFLPPTASPLLKLKLRDSEVSSLSLPFFGTSPSSGVWHIHL